MIVRRKLGWYVVSKDGKKLGGPYKSEEQAKTRLKQVEYFKHKGERGEKVEDKEDSD